MTYLSLSKLINLASLKSVNKKTHCGQAKCKCKILRFPICSKVITYKSIQHANAIASQNISIRAGLC